MHCAAGTTAMTTDRPTPAGGIDGLRPVDHHFGDMLARRARHDPDAIALAAALACAELGKGHLCLDLDETSLPEWALAAGLDVARVRAALRAEPGLCQDCATPGEARPLVLDGSRVYLHRYWLAEHRVAARLRALAGQPVALHADAPRWLDALYPGNDSGTNAQKLACATALTRGLGVISGGPGTGKTTTVARLLAVYARDALARGERIAVRLAAPTGKAAARVGEALAHEFARLGEQGLLDPALRAALPTEALTLHRLLGASATRGFAHHRANPLAADLVVVDECSMIDLRLLDALLEALPVGARLLLLGDRDQLAAVEPGNVFGALCAHAGTPGPARGAELQALCRVQVETAPGADAITDAIAVLHHSYRFDATSGIGRLAAAVNAGNHAEANATLATGDSVRVTAYDGCIDGAELRVLRDAYRELAAAAIAARGNPAAAAALPVLQQRFRVLCALRDGAVGVSALNRELAQALAEAGLADRGRVHYPGRPLIITRNDHELRLYNGDLGIVVDDEDSRPLAVFAHAGGVRLLPAARLPEHETAYALTVHKSQGSEFDRIALVLPPAAAASGLAGRELLYTAITRARTGVELLLPGGRLDACWLERTRLRSGLARRLSGHDEQPRRAGARAQMAV